MKNKFNELEVRKLIFDLYEDEIMDEDDDSTVLFCAELDRKKSCLQERLENSKFVYKNCTIRADREHIADISVEFYNHFADEFDSGEIICQEDIDNPIFAVPVKAIASIAVMRKLLIDYALE